MKLTVKRVELILITIGIANLIVGFLRHPEVLPQLNAILDTIQVIGGVIDVLLMIYAPIIFAEPKGR